MSTTDDPANGEGTDQSVTEASTYGSKGRILTYTRTEDSAGPEVTAEEAYTYGSKGRLVSYTIIKKLDGVTVSSISGTVTYDATTTTETQPRDEDGDGDVDRTVVVTSPSS